MALDAVNVSQMDAPGCGNYSNSSAHMTDCNQTFTNASGLGKATKAKEVDAFRILLYTLIFLLSVFGNLLIIIVLVLNKRMRTVTNSFLLSLAVSDLMMALFCMPFTLIPNILEDFIFGEAMCKITAYLMGISVSISTFSLVAIAIERYSAICNPLKSRLWQTRSHAYKVITLTWALSLLLMVPYPVFSIIKSFKKPGGAEGHMCRLSWPSSQAEQAWYMILLFLLFFIPGVVMMVAYGLISKELYKGMQFELTQSQEAGQQNGATRPMMSDDDDGCYIQKKTTSSVEMPTRSSTKASKPERARSNASQAKLQAKRRVVRMLMVIVALFFICWMPLYIVNTWKAFDPKTILKALSGAPISFIHLLSYSSACVNPIIYCFMNTRFRKALFSTFSCLCNNRICNKKKDGNDDGFTAMSTATSMATSMSKVSYTTVSSVATC
ncbi:cholecystokinin receptor-like [Eucyclogobius newberryi]|uniref:cholecystokinin receptor-like n=1 Tax=Eucyclogobius newberryi TaxID=166745 RepID=UPI003B592B89